MVLKISKKTHEKIKQSAIIIYVFDINSFDQKRLQKENIQVDNLTYIEFQKYNFLISDRSGIFIEYSLIFKRKAFLINTQKKIVNTEYLKLQNKPIEISLRNTLAKSYEISQIPEIIKEILAHKNLQKSNESNNEIEKIIKSNFY